MRGKARFASGSERAELTTPSEQLQPGSFILSVEGEQGRGVVALPRLTTAQHGIILGGSDTGKSRGYFLPNRASSKRCRIPSLSHDEPSAYYAPARDYVNLPHPETFDTPENYYVVAFHELTHSTGQEARLNRAGVAGSRLAAFGSADYSREELVAEMGAPFFARRQA